MVLWIDNVCPALDISVSQNWNDTGPVITHFSGNTRINTSRRQMRDLQEVFNPFSLPNVEKLTQAVESCQTHVLQEEAN